MAIFLRSSHEGVNRTREYCRNQTAQVDWLRSVELSKFDVEYIPRSAVNRQALVDFVTHFTGFPVQAKVTPNQQPWQVFIDGSTFQIGRGIGIYIVE